MTERWRERLGKLDDVSPSDDVLQRAKAGPQLPEEMIPRPKATTRIATAIAAFVVFALAISVFAIPALRMREGAGTAGTAGLEPLWPWHSIADVESFVADPHALGDLSPSELDKPDAVASGFGRQVLSWDDAWAQEVGVPQTSCATYSNVMTPPPIMPAATNSTTQCVVHYLDPFSSPSDEAWTPTTPPPGLRTFSLSTCPPSALCDYNYPGPPDVRVVMYQPLGSEGPWAVLEAQSQSARLSASSGGTIKDGETISTSVQIPNGYFAELGIGGGSGECAFTQATTGFHSPGAGTATAFDVAGAQLEARLSPPRSGCPSTSGGYAFAAVAEQPFTVGDKVSDPIAGHGPWLFAFAAVPITLLFPESAQESSETPTQVSMPPTSPTVERGTPVAVGLGSYTDQLGWTIDVPDGWNHAVVDGLSDGPLTLTGAWFSSGTPQTLPGPINFPGNPVPEDDGVMIKIWHPDAGPTRGSVNDSSFPLSPDDLQPEANVAGAQLMAFHGDGLEFELELTYGQNADIGALTPLIDEMIESIAFQPWEVGETRNGLTALETPQDGMEWEPFGDSSKQVIVIATAELPEGYVMLGPVTCDEGSSISTSWTPSAVCPGDATQAAWDATGQPGPNNAPGFQHPLAVHPVIRSWDGKILGSFAVTIDYSKA
jgi:hypothetical protein